MKTINKKLMKLTKLVLGSLAILTVTANYNFAYADALTSFYGSSNGLESRYSGTPSSNSFSYRRGNSSNSNFTSNSGSNSNYFPIYRGRRNTNFFSGLGLSGSASYNGDTNGRFTVSSNYTTVGTGKVRRSNLKIIPYTNGKAPHIAPPSGNYTRIDKR